MSEIQGGARRAKSASKIAGRAPSDRRNQILSVAAKRFAEFGYEATTIREIADGANILSGSIYHHFDTKDEILDEIIRIPSLIMGSRSCYIAACDADPETKLVALILIQLIGLTTNSEAYSILWNERRFLRKHSHFDYILKNKADMTNSWTSVLREGVKFGYFKPKLDPFLTISTSIRILTTSTEWFMRDGNFSVSGIRQYSRDEVIDFNIETILRSIRDDSRISAPIPRLDAEQRLNEGL